jgi:cell division protein ZapA (FtsZ GTPase activity inhibitor)
VADVKRTQEIALAGTKFVLKTDASPGTIEQAARLVEQKLEQVRQVSKSVETQRLALLAALGLAEELCRERQARERLRRQVREKTDRLLGDLDRLQVEVESRG